MSSRLRRIVPIAACVVCLTGLSVGTAQATSQVFIRGPFADQAACDSTNAATNSPPDVVNGACFFSATRPSDGFPDPGWYYSSRVSLN